MPSVDFNIALFKEMVVAPSSDAAALCKATYGLLQLGGQQYLSEGHSNEVEPGAVQHLNALQVCFTPGAWGTLHHNGGRGGAPQAVKPQGYVTRVVYDTLRGGEARRPFAVLRV
jgi:hypothetical protein